MTLSFSQAAIGSNGSGNLVTTIGATFTSNFQQGQCFVGFGSVFTTSAFTSGNIVTITDGTKVWGNSQILDFLTNVDNTPIFTLFLPQLTPGANAVTFQMLNSNSASFPSIQGHIVNNGENAFIAGHSINFSKSLSSSPATTAAVVPTYPGSYFYSVFTALFNTPTTVGTQGGFTLETTVGNFNADAFMVQTSASSVKGQWFVTTGSNFDYLTAMVAVTQALCNNELPTLGVGCSLGEVELGAALWAAKKLRENAVIPRRSLLLLKERFSR